MATLSVVLDIPEWTKDMLQQAVHDIDELDSGEGGGIEASNVTAWDVIQYIATAELGIVELITGPNGSLGGAMTITVNKMED